MVGVSGYRSVFVIRDIFSGLYHAFPTKSRTAEGTIVECFKTFVGLKEKGVFKLYSDMGRKISVCAKSFHVLRQHGTPGIHRSSAVIERANREVIDRARTVLDQA
eukprot:10716760-Lingulodinium_polyedra.AAC.1